MSDLDNARKKVLKSIYDIRSDIIKDKKEASARKNGCKKSFYIIICNGKKVIRRTLKNLTQFFDCFKLKPRESIVTYFVDSLVCGLHLFHKPITGFIFLVKKLLNIHVNHIITMIIVSLTA